MIAASGLVTRVEAHGMAHGVGWKRPQTARGPYFMMSPLILVSHAMMYGVIVRHDHGVTD